MKELSIGQSGCSYYHCFQTSAGELRDTSAKDCYHFPQTAKPMPLSFCRGKLIFSFSIPCCNASCPPCPVVLSCKYRFPPFVETWVAVKWPSNKIKLKITPIKPTSTETIIKSACQKMLPYFPIIQAAIMIRTTVPSHKRNVLRSISVCKPFCVFRYFRSWNSEEKSTQ